MSIKREEKNLYFQNKLNEVYPDEIILIGDYINNRTKVLVKHTHCNNEFEIRPSDYVLKKQSKCKFCHQINRMKDNIDAYLTKNNLKDEYIYNLKDAKFQYEKIEFKHKRCNGIFYKCIDTFLQGQHCPSCSGGRTTKGSAQASINELTSDGEFIILNTDSEVNRHDVYVDLLHNKCNKTMNVNLNYFLFQSHKCKNCEVKVKSFPEEKIASLLDKHSVNYKRQLTFNDCKGSSKWKLYFDFAIFDKNNNLLFLIEYDGEQHFGSKQFGEERFKKTREYDLIKNEYCKNNNIPLYRIPFKKYRFINSIINNILYQNNVIDNIEYKIEKYKTIEEYKNYYKIKYSNAK